MNPDRQPSRIVGKPTRRRKPELVLIARPGARFRCSGDGLCCTSIHALGPITRAEARAMRRIDPGSVCVDEGIKDLCMKPVGDGRCFFLENGRCEAHHKYGLDVKPDGCRRFPYGLVETPSGARVTTEHRCSCRTLGERPPIDLDEARRSLTDAAGRMEPEQVIPGEIWMTWRRKVPFARYEKVERRMLAELAAGKSGFAVLAADPLPPLHKRSWVAFAAEYLDVDDDTPGGVLDRWFGDALLELAGGHRPPRRARPWRRAFDKAMARTVKKARARTILNDWLADEIWMFRWLQYDVSFDVARAEMATRLAIAETVRKRLMKEYGLREDQAAAEAVTVTETSTVSDEWGEAMDAIANQPSPARRLPGG